MAIKTSKNKEAYYAKYQVGKVAERNRRIKLERQLVLQPNNAEQIQLAIKNISYRRKTPKAPFWSHQMVNTAKLFKHFVGVFDKGVFSTTPEASAAAVRVRNNNLFSVKNNQKVKNVSMFSIGERCHNGAGVLIWAK